MSAYVDGVSIAKKLGYSELVDIGSGDGRIAFCGTILGFTSHSIEIDDVSGRTYKISICTGNKSKF